jgi:hypothetical protein
MEKGFIESVEKRSGDLIWKKTIAGGRARLTGCSRFNHSTGGSYEESFPYSRFKPLSSSHLLYYHHNPLINELTMALTSPSFADL